MDDDARNIPSGVFTSLPTWTMTLARLFDGQ